MCVCFFKAGAFTVLCRKNCSGSPHCLNGLGEKKWLNNDDPAMPNVDPDSLKRGEVWYELLQFLYNRPFFLELLLLWVQGRK